LAHWFGPTVHQPRVTNSSRSNCPIATFTTSNDWLQTANSAIAGEPVNSRKPIVDRVSPILVRITAYTLTLRQTSNSAIMERQIMDTRAFSMACVLHIAAGAVAMTLIVSATPSFAQCETKCDGSIRDVRDDRSNQRDPEIVEPTEVEELVFVAPPLFQGPASNSPVTRGSNGQIRSSWAVGVFR
jgi:hypothetical protein